MEIVENDERQLFISFFELVTNSGQPVPIYGMLLSASNKLRNVGFIFTIDTTTRQTINIKFAVVSVLALRAPTCSGSEIAAWLFHAYIKK